MSITRLPYVYKIVLRILLGRRGDIHTYFQYVINLSRTRLVYHTSYSSSQIKRSVSTPISLSTPYLYNRVHKRMRTNKSDIQNYFFGFASNSQPLIILCHKINLPTSVALESSSRPKL